MGEMVEAEFMSEVAATSQNFTNFGCGRRCILGIDEAGRGPVLGPMVYACAISPVESAEGLKEFGVADSKALAEQKRVEILSSFRSEKSKEIFAYAYLILPARMISAAMLGRTKYSLNELSHDSAIALIRCAIDRKINIAEVFVDTVGPKESYESKLKKCFPNIKVTVSEKADSLYPIVSAASIVAKVHRDENLKNWSFPENNIIIPEGGYGSGYPNDPNTKKFIVESVDPVFGYSTLVRFSWRTAEDALQKFAVKCNWEDPITAKQNSTKQQISTISFAQPIRHAFFGDVCVSSVTEF